jgi:hypothetical protein
MKKTIIKILVAITSVTLLYPAFCGAIEFKGMSYCGWNWYAYSSTDSNTSLANLKDTGWAFSSLTGKTFEKIIVKPKTVENGKICWDACGY